MLFLAESTPSSWQMFMAAVSLAGAVPTILLAWLHFRLNGMHQEHRQEVQRIEGMVSKEVSHRTLADKELYAHLSTQYVQKEALDAKFETVNLGVRNLDNRIGVFITAIQQTDVKLDKHGERLSVLEGARSRE